MIKIPNFLKGENLGELLKQPPMHSINCTENETDNNLHPQDSSSTEDVEMELSEDFLSFLAKSIEHKNERSIFPLYLMFLFTYCIPHKYIYCIYIPIAENKSLDEAVSYINVDEIPVELRPKDLPEPGSHAKADDSYEELYGTAAPTIRAMETTIQVQFHSNCDRKQPKLWPNMPLRL